MFGIVHKYSPLRVYGNDEYITCHTMVDVRNQCNVIVYHQCYACQPRIIIEFNAREHADINASQESVGVKISQQNFPT